MSLRDDIEREVSSRRETKADKLLKIRDDIEYMLESKLSLKKQLELLLRNEIVEKLDMKEYRNILIKHFGYQSRTITKSKPKPKTKPNNKESKIISPTPTIQKKSAKEILSQEITL